MISRERSTRKVSKVCKVPYLLRADREVQYDAALSCVFEAGGAV